MKPKGQEFCKSGKFSTYIYRYDWENFGKNIGQLQPRNPKDRNLAKSENLAHIYIDMTGKILGKIWEKYRLASAMKPK